MGVQVSCWWNSLFAKCQTGLAGLAAKVNDEHELQLLEVSCYYLTSCMLPSRFSQLTPALQSFLKSVCLAYHHGMDSSVPLT